MQASTTGYPVELAVEYQEGPRNRVTVLFRLFLAIPQVLLVGAPMVFPLSAFDWNDSGDGGSALGGLGALGAAVGVMAVIAWFGILFANNHPRGLWDFAQYYLRWRVKVLSYATLLRDEYPPFGEGDYPVTFRVDGPPAVRNKVTVGFRIFFVIPHFVVLIFLSIAWAVVTFVGWLAILFTGTLPRGIHDFSEGVMRWTLRVEAYAFLLRDEYPPFSLHP